MVDKVGPKRDVGQTPRAAPAKPQTSDEKLEKAKAKIVNYVKTTGAVSPAGKHKYTNKPPSNDVKPSRIRTAVSEALARTLKGPSRS